MSYVRTDLTMGWNQGCRKKYFTSPSIRPIIELLWFIWVPVGIIKHLGKVMHSDLGQFYKLIFNDVHLEHFNLNSKRCFKWNYERSIYCWNESPTWTTLSIRFLCLIGTLGFAFTVPRNKSWCRTLGPKFSGFPVVCLDSLIRITSMLKSLSINRLTAWPILSR